MVVSVPGIGQYYGVQGTSWKAPPILDSPSETRKIDGRTYELFYDGGRLRLVAWRTDRARLLGLQHAAADADQQADARPRRRRSRASAPVARAGPRLARR